MRFTAVLAVLLVCVGFCSAATYNLSPDNQAWADTLRNLTAGDTAILAPGEYIINGTFALNLAGRSDALISIKGTVVDGTQQSIIKQQGTSNNILNIAGSYFGLYNLTLTCAGTCLRGLSMVGATSHATFEDLVIHHTNRTGFAATATGVDYTALTVRRVEVYDTGLDTSECFLFGCSTNQCRVHDSTIELNYCHDISDTMTNFGVGIQVNTGSYKNIIRNNVVSKTNAAGIRVFDDYGKGVNLIEGNAVTQTKGNGIQVSSGAVVRNNIITDVAVNGIAVSNSQLKTANSYHDIQIVHNTVIRSNSADLMLPALSGDDFVVANNAFLSAKSFSVGQQTSTVVWRNNAYVGGSTPTGVSASSLILVNASSVVGEKYYPTNSSALINAGTRSYPNPVTWDYNGTPRSATTPTIGAYEYTTATNPGQDVGTTIKTPLPAYPSDSYTDVPDSDSGSGGGGSGGGDNSAASLAQSWISLILA